MNEIISPNGKKYIRENKMFNYRSEHGKSRCDIKCPFCNWVVTAYVWSLSGSGKKCPSCNAKHAQGVSYKTIGDGRRINK